MDRKIMKLVFTYADFTIRFIQELTRNASIFIMSKTVDCHSELFGFRTLYNDQYSNKLENAEFRKVYLFPLDCLCGLVVRVS
jgi:hypothetical protein